MALSSILVIGLVSFASYADGQKLRGSAEIKGNASSGCKGRWCDGVPEKNFAVLVEKQGDDVFLVDIGDSKASEKCVTPKLPVTCVEDAAELGKRVNDAEWEEKVTDKFVITVNGTKVCARRTDKEEGWGLPLKIQCTEIVTKQPGEKCMCLTNPEGSCDCKGCSDAEQQQTCHELLGPCACQRSDEAICSCSGYCHTQEHRKSACLAEAGCKWSGEWCEAQVGLLWE